MVRPVLSKNSIANPGGVAVQQRETMVDGLRMHARVAGSGDPLLLVHGLLGAASCWDPAMLRLAAGARVFAVDAVGIGRSERSAGIDAGLEASARRLARWMDAQALTQVDLVGTSHGGAVAMYFAALFPQRVRRLILHAPANPFCIQSRPQIGFACTAAGRFLARRLPGAPSRLHRLALTRMYGDPSRLRPGSLEEYVESMRVPGTVDYVLGVLENWKKDMASLTPLLTRLRNLPVLLLWGELDRAVSLSSGLRLRSALRAEMDVMSGLGHLPFEEAPELFADKVLAFLATGEQAVRSRRTA